MTIKIIKANEIRQETALYLANLYLYSPFFTYIFDAPPEQRRILMTNFFHHYFQLPIESYLIYEEEYYVGCFFLKKKEFNLIDIFKAGFIFEFDLKTLYKLYSVYNFQNNCLQTPYDCELQFLCIFNQFQRQNFASDALKLLSALLSASTKKLIINVQDINVLPFFIKNGYQVFLTKQMKNMNNWTLLKVN